MKPLQTQSAKQNRKQIILFCLWAALVAFLFFRHENWRDEAQSWLLARDLDIPGLIAQMSYEGHPCLWHLLLMPFAKLGFPYQTMNVISIAITAASVALLLWRAPFPLGWRVACLCGVAFLYSMPVVSRSYCLIPLFLFMNACIYPSRRRRPLRYGLTIALLVQTHTYMLGMAGVMAAVWLAESLCIFHRDRDRGLLLKQAAGLMLPLLSFLFLMVQIASSSQSSAFNPSAFSVSRVIHSLLTNFQVNRGVFSRFASAGGMVKGVSWLVALLLMASLALVLLLRLWKKDGEALKVLVIFALGILARTLITAILYADTNTQKKTMVLFMVIWMLWTLWPHLSLRLEKALVLAALCCVCAVNTLNMYDALQDVSQTYSDARNCAEYIETSIPEDALVFQSLDAETAAILPYLSRDGFYSLTTGEYTSFTTWKDVEPVITGYDLLCRHARSIDPDAREVWLIACPEDERDRCGEWFPEYIRDDFLVYESRVKPVIFDEYYVIYCIPLNMPAGA